MHIFFCHFLRKEMPQRNCQSSRKQRLSHLILAGDFSGKPETRCETKMLVLMQDPEARTPGIDGAQLPQKICSKTMQSQPRHLEQRAATKHCTLHPGTEAEIARGGVSTPSSPVHRWEESGQQEQCCPAAHQGLVTVTASLQQAVALSKNRRVETRFL